MTYLSLGTSAASHYIETVSTQNDVQVFHLIRACVITSESI